MAILWMDGFETYGTGSSSDEVMEQYGLYISASTGCSTTQKRTGNASMRADLFRRGFGGDKSVVGVGFALWLDELPVAPNFWECFIFRNNLGTVLCKCRVGINGDIILYRGDTTTIIDRSAAGVITAGGWYHLECRFEPDGATSTIEIRVGEVTVLSLSSFAINGTSTTVSSVGWYGGVNNSYVDDLYAWDDTGGIYDDFLGDKRVATLWPNADTSEADWTPNSGGTGYTQIDETPPDGDTTYIYSSTVGDISNFLVEAMPSTAINIAGLQVVAAARKTDTGDGTIRADVISNGATGTGASAALTTAYISRVDMFQVDPDTGVGWTKDAIDAIEISIEREA